MHSSAPLVKKARPAVLEKFFRQHNCRNDEKLQQRLEEIRSAVPATRDAIVIGAALPMVAVWVKQIALLRESIPNLEKETAQLARQQEDWAIFDSLPGAGDVLAPRLMAAMGTRRERFQSASELQCFSGIAPVKEASGNSEWVHILTLSAAKCKAYPGSVDHAVAPLVRPARSFCDRPFTSGRPAPSHIATGPRPSMTSCVEKARNTTSRSGPWLSNGCASSTAAGWIGSRIAKRPSWPIYGETQKPFPQTSGCFGANAVNQL